MSGSMQTAPTAESADSSCTSQRALAFRRVEYTGHPADVWAALIKGGDSSGKKAIMRMERAEVPEAVRRSANTPAQMEAAGVAAAVKSVTSFMECVDTIRSSSEASQKILMLEMKHVGIKCEGRSGPYDLLYFPHKDKVYAADSSDDSIVYVGV